MVLCASDLIHAAPPHVPVRRFLLFLDAEEDYYGGPVVPNAHAGEGARIPQRR